MPGEEWNKAVLHTAARGGKDHGSAADAEYRTGDGAVDGLGAPVVPDARRQDRSPPGEQPEAHPGLLPELDRAGPGPGPGHPRGYAGPPGAGPAPAGGLRDALPGGDQRLLRVPQLGDIVLPGSLEHGHAGRPAEPPAGRTGDPA